MGGVTEPLKKQSHPTFDTSYMAFFSKKCGVTAIKRKTDTNYLTLLYHSGKKFLVTLILLAKYMSDWRRNHKYFGILLSPLAKGNMKGFTETKIKIKNKLNLLKFLLIISNNSFFLQSLKTRANSVHGIWVTRRYFKSIKFNECSRTEFWNTERFRFKLAFHPRYVKLLIQK